MTKPRSLDTEAAFRIDITRWSPQNIACPWKNTFIRYLSSGPTTTYLQLLPLFLCLYGKFTSYPVPVFPDSIHQQSLQPPYPAPGKKSSQSQLASCLAEDRDRDKGGVETQMVEISGNNGEGAARRRRFFRRRRWGDTEEAWSSKVNDFNPFSEQFHIEAGKGKWKGRKVCEALASSWGKGCQDLFPLFYSTPSGTENKSPELNKGEGFYGIDKSRAVPAKARSRLYFDLQLNEKSPAKAPWLDTDAGLTVNQVSVGAPADFYEINKARSAGMGSDKRLFDLLEDLIIEPTNGKPVDLLGLMDGLIVKKSVAGIVQLLALSFRKKRNQDISYIKEPRNKDAGIDDENSWKLDNLHAIPRSGNFTSPFDEYLSPFYRHFSRRSDNFSIGNELTFPSFENEQREA
ncbi:hypothetical protein WH47_01014 [Habropoda laboriosa]|uniref:Uncharacterized protein n=1 Tax=Habropoda laboriosa TaxID=597456 RepID=A0A0L7R5T1_9HYME|nr:hypothetical protein WH47_01014 [Habropoda laboriosa]